MQACLSICKSLPSSPALRERKRKSLSSLSQSLHLSSPPMKRISCYPTVIAIQIPHVQQESKYLLVRLLFVQAKQIDGCLWGQRNMSLPPQPWVQTLRAELAAIANTICVYTAAVATTLQTLQQQLYSLPATYSMDTHWPRTDIASLWALLSTAPYGCLVLLFASMSSFLKPFERRGFFKPSEFSPLSVCL